MKKRCALSAFANSAEEASRKQKPATFEKIHSSENALSRLCFVPMDKMLWPALQFQDWSDVSESFFEFQQYPMAEPPSGHCLFRLLGKKTWNCLAASLARDYLQSLQRALQHFRATESTEYRNGIVLMFGALTHLQGDKNIAIYLENETIDGTDPLDWYSKNMMDGKDPSDWFSNVPGSIPFDDIDFDEESSFGVVTDVSSEDEDDSAALPIAIQRKLLTCFVPASFTTQDVLSEPKFHLLGTDEALIHANFKSRFGHLKLSQKNLAEMVKQAPPEGFIRKTDIISCDYVNSLKKTLSEAQASFNRAADAERALLTPAKSDRCIMVEAIFHILQSKGTRLAHTGASTYAEPRRGGIDSLIEALRTLKISSKDVIIDMGSGLGTVLFYLCHAFGCKGLGVEYDSIRWELASHYFGQLLEKMKENTALNHNVVTFHKNILEMKMIPSNVTVLYMFDEAFEPKVFQHVIDLITTAHSNLKFLITFKGQREGKYHEELKEKGFQQQRDIKMEKIVSGECSTCRIYQCPNFGCQNGTGTKVDGIEAKAIEYWELSIEKKIAWNKTRRGGPREKPKLRSSRLRHTNGQ